MSKLPTLEHLRALIAVAETGSFHGAAVRLHRVQSAVSQAIAKLEEDVGARLFDRTSRPVALTAQGRAILEDAQMVVKDLRALQARAESFSLGVETTLTIAFDSIFPRAILAQSLVDLKATYPTVAVRLMSLVPADPVQMVAQGQADIGIGLSLGSAQRALVLERLGYVRLVPAVNSSHPLASLPKGFDDSRLREYTEIRVLDGSRSIGAPEAPAERFNAWSVVDLESIKALILAGIGWGLLPHHAIKADLDCKRLKVLVPKSRYPDGYNPVGVYTITRGDGRKGPALGRFVESLRSHALDLDQVQSKVRSTRK